MFQWRNGDISNDKIASFDEAQRAWAALGGLGRAFWGPKEHFPLFKMAKLTNCKCPSVLREKRLTD